MKKSINQLTNQHRLSCHHQQCKQAGSTKLKVKLFSLLMKTAESPVIRLTVPLFFLLNTFLDYKVFTTNTITCFERSYLRCSNKYMTEIFGIAELKINIV